MILMTSSLNFGLKGADEQTAIIVQFQNFLNSIEFPTQIYIQSKRLDIQPYLKLLENREKMQLVDAMRIQVHEYVAFIRDFTNRTNIMSKSFFIVIPYSAGGLNSGKSSGKGGEKKGFLDGVFGKSKGPKKQMTDKELQSFEEARIQLEQRVSIIEQGLSRCDIRTSRLGSEEITELFYKKFNPGELDSAIT